MGEETFETGLTLGKAKQFLHDNFLAYTMKKDSKGMILGEYEWTVQCKEEIDDYREEKRNFRLYTRGLEDNSYARWEKNQCPTQYRTSNPSTPPESSFTSRVDAYIKKKTEDDTIKFGFIVQSSELLKKALCNVIMFDKTDKVLLVSESPKDVFTYEVLQ